MKDRKKRQILETALKIFFRYGYRRVNMKEIAEAAGISRPGLYLYFKTKEEVFGAAILQQADELIAEIQDGIATKKTLEDKIMYAFEVWSVQTFEQALQSPEAKEINEHLFEFAKDSFDTGRAKFENILAGAIKSHVQSDSLEIALSPSRTAQILSGSQRGFRLSAKSGAELRKMIHDLVKLTLRK